MKNKRRNRGQNKHRKYTITKSASKFIYELLLSKVESLDKFISNKNSKKFARLGGFDLDDLCKKINVLENRPLWINDFLHLPIPKRVLEGREAPDAVNK